MESTCILDLQVSIGWQGILATIPAPAEASMVDRTWRPARGENARISPRNRRMSGVTGASRAPRGDRSLPSRVNKSSPPPRHLCVAARAALAPNKPVRTAFSLQAAMGARGSKVGSEGAEGEPVPFHVPVADAAVGRVHRRERPYKGQTHFIHQDPEGAANEPPAVRAALTSIACTRRRAAPLPKAYATRGDRNEGGKLYVVMPSSRIRVKDRMAARGGAESQPAA